MRLHPHQTGFSKKRSWASGLGLCLLLISFTAQAAMYRWTDEQGNVHMSDKPPPANVEYEVMDRPRPNVVETPKPPPPPEDIVDTLGEPADEPPKEVTYRSLRIIQPQEDEGVRSNSGEITITVSPSPGLGEDDKIVIYLDNKIVSRGEKTSVTVPNLTRGTHKTRAVIINRKGRTVIKSPTVTFHVLRFAGGGRG